MKILVADDDATFRLIAKMMLESLGHECTAVDDGAEAWDHYQYQQPDVVISDLMMPGLSGLDLCRNIRAFSPESYTYFIMVSANGGLGVIVEGMNAGADEFLVKPMRSDDLHVRLMAAERVTSLHHLLASPRTELDA
jgi:DNA-binding response OmpR family regulator